MCNADIFLGLIAILFPPLAVWVKRSICSADSLINIALCCLGFFPGLLHAWYIIAKYPETADVDERGYAIVPQRDPERARAGSVTYYYVDHQPSGASGPRMSMDAGPQPPPRSYGTVPGPGAEGGVEGDRSGGGSGAGVPPSYEQAVRGDNKVQTRE
ncbi:MAG: hypothetical protein M1837_001138 [Sclerophora amabilis]|nr:MAG: hypothetical protein M1837_001138 [Sclerophora amabilis]